MNLSLQRRIHLLSMILGTSVLTMTVIVGVVGIFAPAINAYNASAITEMHQVALAAGDPVSTPPIYFKVRGNIANGDQFDPRFSYNFNTSTVSGSTSRSVPFTLNWGTPNQASWPSSSSVCSNQGL